MFVASLVAGRRGGTEPTPGPRERSPGSRATAAGPVYCPGGGHRPRFHLLPSGSTGPGSFRPLRTGGPLLETRPFGNPLPWRGRAQPGQSAPFSTDLTARYQVARPTSIRQLAPRKVHGAAGGRTVARCGVCAHHWRAWMVRAARAVATPSLAEWWARLPWLALWWAPRPRSTKWWARPPWWAK